MNRNLVKAKEQERKNLENQVKEFLSSGSKIKQIDSSKSSASKTGRVTNYGHNFHI